MAMIETELPLTYTTLLLYTYLVVIVATIRCTMILKKSNNSSNNRQGGSGTKITRHAPHITVITAIHTRLLHSLPHKRRVPSRRRLLFRTAAHLTLSQCFRRRHCATWSLLLELPYAPTLARAIGCTSEPDARTAGVCSLSTMSEKLLTGLLTDQFAATSSSTNAAKHQAP